MVPWVWYLLEHHYHGSVTNWRQHCYHVHDTCWSAATVGLVPGIHVTSDEARYPVVLTVSDVTASLLLLLL